MNQDGFRFTGELMQDLVLQVRERVRQDVAPMLADTFREAIQRRAGELPDDFSIDDVFHLVNIPEQKANIRLRQVVIQVLSGPESAYFAYRPIRQVTSITTKTGDEEQRPEYSNEVRFQRKETL